MRNTSVFNDQINKRKNLIFLIEDEEGEKFGYYLNDEIITDNQFKQWIHVDNNSFQFDFNKNQRNKYPMKYECIDDEFKGYMVFDNYNNGLIYLGNISLEKENSEKSSYRIMTNEENILFKTVKNVTDTKERIKM